MNTIYFFLLVFVVYATAAPIYITPEDQEEKELNIIGRLRKFPTTKQSKNETSKSETPNIALQLTILYTMIGIFIALASVLCCFAFYFCFSRSALRIDEYSTSSTGSTTAIPPVYRYPPPRRTDRRVERIPSPPPLRRKSSRLRKRDSRHRRAGRRDRWDLPPPERLPRRRRSSQFRRPEGVSQNTLRLIAEQSDKPITLFRNPNWKPHR